VVPPANTVTRIDAASSAFTEPIGVGQDPIGVAVGSGSVWVINQRSQTLTRIDAAAGQEEATMATQGTPTGVAAGAEAVWISNGFGSQSGGSQVVVVNPADDSVKKAFDSPNAKAIAVAFDSIWLADTDRDVVLRYDPRDLTAPPVEILMDDSPSVESGPSFLAVGTGSASGIWVVNELGDTVVRIDPETNEVNPRVQVTQPTAVAAGDAGVWVTSHGTDTVTRIDPASGTTKQTLTLGEDGIPDGPTTIVLAPGGVWIASDLDQVVVRVDPATNQVAERLAVAGVAEGMAVDTNGGVWVTVHAP
jgi:streptogramin lyase